MLSKRSKILVTVIVLGVFVFFFNLIGRICSSIDVFGVIDHWYCISHTDDISFLTSSDMPTPIVKEVDLETYTKSEHDYEFKYPASWKMVKELQASSIDYLPGSRNFVAIYPTNYPAQDFSARVDVYNKPIETVRREHPTSLYRGVSKSMIVNDILWTVLGRQTNIPAKYSSLDYLVERGGKTYHISGETGLTHQIVSTFRFTNK